MTFGERIRKWVLRLRCPTEFPGENCRYASDSAGHRRERPNATRCPDYKSK